MKFSIEKKLAGRDGKPKLGRVGRIETTHGVIETPAFIVVGTKAAVKAVRPEDVGGGDARDGGVSAEAVLANTYHLYLQPGDEIVRDAGGLSKFMNWKGPTFTDSGGFQVFSLGVAFGNKTTKIGAKNDVMKSDPAKTDEKTDEPESMHASSKASLAKIDEDGVTFRSVIDGSEHRFTPERSMDIQHNIGADIIFAFDECTSPTAPHEYQKEAMDRTHRWAQRSLDQHQKNMSQSKSGESKGPNPDQALFGIVQGGRFEDLRKESAKIIADIKTSAGHSFDGFGIGGSFDKEDMYTAVGWVNEILPEDKPRHLLGIGEPEDLFGGIENGADTFDCVAPTRLGRNGTLYTHAGKVHITNTRFTRDFTPIEKDCGCHTCRNYTSAYISHLFKADEMLAGTLASIHNLYFIVNLVKKIRQAILDDTYEEFKKEFLSKYIKAGGAK